MTGRKNVNAGAVYACDIDSECVSEVQGLEFCTIGIRLCHENMTGYQHSVYVVPVYIFLVPVFIYDFSEKFFCCADLTFFGHDHDMFTFFQNSVSVGDDNRSLSAVRLVSIAVEFPYARNNKAYRHIFHYVLQRLSVDGRIADFELGYERLVVM